MVLFFSERFGRLRGLVSSVVSVGVLVEDMVDLTIPSGD